MQLGITEQQVGLDPKHRACKHAEEISLRSMKLGIDLTLPESLSPFNVHSTLILCYVERA